MSQEAIGSKTFTAGEALEAYRRVKLSSGSGTAVEYADAGEDALGITAGKAASGAPVTVNFIHPGRSFIAVAADSFSAGATLYGAADGKVSDSSAGPAIGQAFEAAQADGDYVEAHLDKNTGESWS